MLHPQLREEQRLADLRERWAARERLRVEGFLQPAAAEGILAALRALPHAPDISGPPQVEYRTWQAVWQPEPACAHALCALGRWFLGDGRRWLEALTGWTLAPPATGTLAAVAFLKGCYLEVHNDTGQGRRLAFVLGFTPATWPAQEGGHLEFLDGPAGAAVERLPPGWNTLDVFAVRPDAHWHRVPILRTHRERRTITGWFYAPPE